MHSQNRKPSLLSIAHRLGVIIACVIICGCGSSNKKSSSSSPQLNLSFAAGAAFQQNQAGQAANDVRFNFSITNTSAGGATAYNVVWQLMRQDGTVIHFGVVPIIAAGASVSVVSNAVGESSGTRTYWLWIDPSNHVFETTESDNRQSFTVTVP